MDIQIMKAQPEDAAELLEYLKVIGSESDNLTFGPDGLLRTVEEEAEFLASELVSQTSVTLVAKRDGKIIGNARFTGELKERTRHRGDIGISVLKSEWGAGLGSRLMEALLDFAKNTAHIEVITLEVNQTNKRAIALYEKFGFKKTGIFEAFTKIDGKYIDFDMMILYL